VDMHTRNAQWGCGGKLSCKQLPHAIAVGAGPDMLSLLAVTIKLRSVSKNLRPQ